MRLKNPFPQAILALLVTAAAALPADAACFRGINLSGAEFGGRDAVIDQQYTYPSDKIVAYFKAKGLNSVRLPFLWERLQPALDQPLASEELDRVKKSVAMMRKAGMEVILDPHNYATYDDKQIGSRVVSVEDFADFWKRLAIVFANAEGVSFGLMNEPHDMPAERWLPSANAAIAAIRDTGAKNLVLVPGTSWTGAHSWQASNAAVMLGVVDPGNNYAFEVHQYLDSNFSGTHAACSRADDAVAALNSMTDWFRKNGKRGFLGEFGGSNEPECLKGLAEMVATVNGARDVWTGWTYWVAGDWWPASEPMNITPTRDGDRPQLKALLGSGLSDKSCAGL
jgi:endoglucanase